MGAFKMKTVSISELRANLLKYLEIVHKGKLITVTSKGRPLATLTPPVSQHTAAKARLKKLAKTATVHDVVSPTDESWDALK
jgi:prevent-host-death family protein